MFAAVPCPNAVFSPSCAGDPLVVDKWFKAQALSDLPDQVERVAALLQHPAFSLKNPNRLRSLVFVFAASNHVHFHRDDGKGYELLADVVLQVRINVCLVCFTPTHSSDCSEYIKDDATAAQSSRKHASDGENGAVFQNCCLLWRLLLLEASFNAFLINWRHLQYMYYERPSGCSMHLLQVDRINPVAASRGAKIFLTWRHYDEQRQHKIEQQLRRILAEPSLSKNVKEVVVLALDSPSSPSVQLES